MEFKLPLPTPRDRAVLEIAHSLVNLEVTHDSLHDNKEKPLKKVDKLDIVDEQKCRVREVLKGTLEQLDRWNLNCRFPMDSDITLYPDFTDHPKFQFDVYGCVDEDRMAKDYLQKHYLDSGMDTNLMDLIHLLTVATSYVFLPDIHEILLKILKLGAKVTAVPQLKGPEFEIDEDDKLCLVYRFVDQQVRPISPYVLYSDSLSSVRVSESCVHITLHCAWYNSELFQLHWNLLEPSKRVPFFKSLILTMSSEYHLRQVVNILSFLDPDSRRLLFDNLDDKVRTFKFFCSLLVWPYQVCFLPALQLVRSLSELHDELLSLFEIIVRKLDMMVFEEILSPFWEAISLEFKSKYSCCPLDRRFENLLRELSRKNAPMYERVAADLDLPLTYFRGSRKRKCQGS